MLFDEGQIKTVKRQFACVIEKKYAKSKIKFLQLLSYNDNHTLPLSSPVGIYWDI
jgi:hypothetical protein